MLAIESATSEPSVALLSGPKVLAERTGPRGASPAEVVLPAVEAVLREAQVALASVSLFAVAIGPGSFTGLRVGLASVKGLAFASGTQVAAVPTLEALCFAAGSAAAPVAALLDARRGEVYAAAYGPGADVDAAAALVPEGLYLPAAFAARLPAGCRLVGDGALLHATTLGSMGFASVGPTSAGCAAAAVGRLGLRLLARGEVHDPARLVPRYLRRAEAEARRVGSALEGQKSF